MSHSYNKALSQNTLNFIQGFPHRVTKQTGDVYVVITSAPRGGFFVIYFKTLFGYSDTNGGSNWALPKYESVASPFDQTCLVWHSSVC